ncbi:ATP-binding protein (plasmid) [Streptomyces rochei]|nr:ATP-binding protein [Streptomyces rochei]WMI61958.1 ATP-binding protein [Streptomyces rochei]
MVSAARDRSQGAPGDRGIAVSAAFGGTAENAEARGLARDFLALVGAVHGLMVTTGAAGMVELVVSELVTNARKYAPGPCLLDLELSEEAVLVSVWDSSTVLPSVLPADANRVGQHGLKLVMAVCESFCVRREPVGKRVTASVPCSGDPGGDANGGAR